MNGRGCDKGLSSIFDGLIVELGVRSFWRVDTANGVSGMRISAWWSRGVAKVSGDEVSEPLRP